MTGLSPRAAAPPPSAQGAGSSWTLGLGLCPRSLPARSAPSSSQSAGSPEAYFTLTLSTQLLPMGHAERTGKEGALRYPKRGFLGPGALSTQRCSTL